MGQIQWEHSLETTLTLPAVKEAALKKPNLSLYHQQGWIDYKFRPLISKD